MNEETLQWYICRIVHLFLLLKARLTERNVAHVNSVVISDSDKVILSVSVTTSQLTQLHKPIKHVIIFSNLQSDASQALEHTR